MIAQNRAYFREWAKARQTFTLNDVLMEAKKCGYPKSNCGRSLMGVNDACVRVDYEHFVPDELVDFNVSGIDKRLDKILGTRAVPYGNITSRDYAILPPVVGYAWNPYLLTSFCWRFSRLFEHICFHTYPHSDVVGAIVRRELKYCSTYREKAFEMLLTDVVRDAGVVVDADAIDAWLRERRWIQKYSGAGKRIAARLRSATADRDVIRL